MYKKGPSALIAINVVNTVPHLPQMVKKGSIKFVTTKIIAKQITPLNTIT
jgi:hypothetical protein